MSIDKDAKRFSKKLNIAKAAEDPKENAGIETKVLAKIIGELSEAVEANSRKNSPKAEHFAPADAHL